MPNFFYQYEPIRIKSFLDWGEFSDIIMCSVYLKTSKNNKLLTEFAKSKLSNLSEDILNVTESIDTNYILNNIEEIVRDFYNVKKYDGFKSSENVSNESINSLVCKLLDVNKQDYVLDLGSGYGNFLYRCDSKTSIGIEINSNSLYMSNIIFELLNKDIRVINDDALYCDVPSFTKGYVFPPIGIKYKDDTFFKINTKNKMHINSKTSAEWFFVDRLISKLPAEGKVVALMPQRPLYFDGDNSYRNFLLENGYVEGIIQLPGNCLHSTPIPVSLVIFSHGNTQVKLVDATKDYKEIGRISNLNVEDIILKYNSNSVITLDYRDIIVRGDMTVEKLLMKPLEIKYSKSILEIGEIFQGSQYTMSNFKDQISNTITDHQLLTSSDIEEGIVNWDTLVSIENADHKLKKFALKKNDVVMTSKSSKVKIVVVDIEPKNNIILTGGMLCIRPNTDIINPVFLKMFLDSEKGKQILKAIQKGTTIPSITVKALSSIEVSCPDISIQNEIAKKYLSKLAIYAAMKKELLELENKINSFYDTVEEDL